METETVPLYATVPGGRYNATLDYDPLPASLTYIVPILWQHGSRRRNELNRPLRGESVACWQLTNQIAHILYYSKAQAQGSSDNFILAYCHDRLHHHDTIGPILATLEPGPRMDPCQLQLVREHLQDEVANTGDALPAHLDGFIENFMTVRKVWLRATANLYAILAYQDMCKRWLYPDGGPSYPGPVGLGHLVTRLGEAREMSDLAYSALYEFKCSDSFARNIIRVFNHFHVMKAEERERGRDNEEARVRALIDERKRKVLREHNRRIMHHQLGGDCAVPMNDETKAYNLRNMEKIMKYELGESTEDEFLHG